MSKSEPLVKIVNGERYYLKLPKHFRYEHYILALTFILLCLTGLPLKFFYYGWAKSLINTLGGIHATRLIHRISGVTMVALFFYHIYEQIARLLTTYVIPALKTSSFSWKEMGKVIYYAPTFPRWKDIKDFIDFVKFATFISNSRPKHERFHWREKFDYWAVFWGIPILGITGVVLWFPVQFTHYIPGWLINLSFIAHSDEALLAVSVILVWHMYNAHLNYDKFPMSPLFMTGYLPEDIMKHEYYLEWERINHLVSKNPSLAVEEKKLDEDEEWGALEKLRTVRNYVDYVSRKSEGKDGQK
jgi:cytochrome b subunit of formate dehydrogenase